MNDRELPDGFGDEIEALMIDESRRGARLVLPFLLPTLYLIWVVLGPATNATDVRFAFSACAAVVVLRWAGLRKMGRPDARAGAAAWRSRAFTVSAWLVSASFAAIYVTAGSAASSGQLLTLAIVATAVCALAILSAASCLLTYCGYVAIHLVALAVVIEKQGEPEVTPLVPAMVLFFVVALTLIAHQNNISVREKITLSMKVKDLGLRDALTGLRNRAFVEVFTEQRAGQIVEQWQNAGRRKLSAGRSLALLLIDLDHFKKINDKHGHAAGDQVLASFAKVARSAVRAGDVVARWGGEEFLIVMEVDDRHTAHGVAERLRAMIASSPVADSSGRLIDVTCSIGACLFPFDPARANELTWQETMELADASLYRAKSEGRNRTVWSQPHPRFTPRQLLDRERDADATTLVFKKAA